MPDISRKSRFTSIVIFCNARFVSSGIFFDDVAEQPFQNEQPVADKMIVRLLSDFSRQLRLPHFLGDEQTATFLLWDACPPSLPHNAFFSKGRANAARPVELLDAQRPGSTIPRAWSVCLSCGLWYWLASNCLVTSASNAAVSPPRSASCCRSFARQMLLPRRHLPARALLQPLRKKRPKRFHFVGLNQLLHRIKEQVPPSRPGA